MDQASSELIGAIQAGDSNTVAELLDRDRGLLSARADNGVSMIALAMYHGRPEIARLFVDRGAALDLFDAAAVGSLPHVRELVEVDATAVTQYSPDGFPPLALAAYFGHLDVVEYLLDHGADVEAAARNSMQVRPIHAAVARRSVPVVRLLLERGADPNARQQRDFTPMDAAVQNGDQAIIELLQAYGAMPPSAPPQS